MWRREAAMTWVLGVLAAGAGIVAVSYLVESLRRAPVPPSVLSWAPQVPIRYVDVDGVRLRCIMTGTGPPVVLLHTLRTQLDLFHRVVPMLATRHTVHAVDLPGHGYSDIPRAEYGVSFFVDAVAGFLDRTGVDRAIVAGESIGGTIALVLAARAHPRVAAVVAVNPYDYDRGQGLRRSSRLANALFGISNVPLIGSSAMRLRSAPVVTHVLRGGVHREDALPAALAVEMYRVGNRPGHYRALMSLVRHWPEWERARATYETIAVPVELVYGEHDWSIPAERHANATAMPTAHVTVVRDAGHFLSLDAPSAFEAAVGRVRDRMNSSGD